MRIFHEPVSLRGYLAVSLLGLGVASIVVAKPTASAPASAPAIAIEVTDDQTRPLEPPQRAHEDDPVGSGIKLVFTDGGESYLALDDLDAQALPPHGKFHTVAGDYTTSALVALDKLPATARAWRDRKVIVDGTCAAKVVGFAIVARLSGDPGYAGEGDTSTWSTSGILDHGHVVLAAKLDRCTGTFARAASAPAVATFVEVGGGNVTEARARLIHSDSGALATKEWASFEQAGAWFDHTELATKTVRDPHTGTIWISMHAHTDSMCGGPNINIWGLFRVESTGALTTVQLRDLGTLAQIDQLVDIDGDGLPELVGRGWITPDAMLTTAAGDELVRLDTPFFGCPC